MATHVCPWWGGYFIDNWFRRLLHNPRTILGPHVTQGMTAVDFGCGMGFFSIAMAKMAGCGACVIAVDVQQRMLDVLRKRAERTGVADRIRIHRCERDSLGLEDPVDFVLAFWSVHEAPDTDRLFGEIHRLLTPGGKMLVVEPRGHVSEEQMEQTVAAASRAGLRLDERPPVRLSRAALFTKSQQSPGADSGE